MVHSRMTALIGHVVSAMTLPLVLLPGFLSACLLRPLPWGMLAGGGASSFILLLYYLDTHGYTAARRRRLPFSFWEELPAWALAGAAWALLFFLLIRGLAWALNRLPRAPRPPG